MPEIEVNPRDADRLECLEHQLLDFDVAFQAGVAEQLCADLQRLARPHHAVGQGVQHDAGVAQAHHAAPVEQMGVDARRLGGDVGAQAHHPAGQLVDHLEGLEVHVVPGPGQQGRQVFEHRRNHLLVSVHVEYVEQAPAQAFDAARVGGQDVFDVFREEPGLRHAGLPARSALS